MAQLDDIVGGVMKKLEDFGVADNTIVVFTTDNGAENFTWPDGGQTPFAGGKGTVLEGGFRVPCIVALARHVPAGEVENGIMSGLDWFPTLARRRRQIRRSPTSSRRASSSATARIKAISTATTRLRCSPGRAPRSATRSSTSPRARSARFASATTSTGSSISRRAGSAAPSKPDWPLLDEPAPRSVRAHGPRRVPRVHVDWFKYQFWRFVFVQEVVEKFAQIFIEYPPLQKPASFNLDAIKEQVKTIAAHHAK